QRLTGDRDRADQYQTAQADAVEGGARFGRCGHGGDCQMRMPFLRLAMTRDRVADCSTMRHISPMSEPVIIVENLVKRYGKTLAVGGIDFTVERGATAALLGGNGAGKTTTLAILLGLLLPTEGSVTVL